MSIRTSAPGKLVVTGEYAVLCGAPAIIAAVNRRVHVDLRRADRGGWQISSTGFVESLHADKSSVFAPNAPSTFGLVGHFLQADDAPAHARIAIDSSACYLDAVKLGVGSSAAVTVALGTALTAWQGETLDLETLIESHRTFQGGGSGLDVATSYLGGIVRFQNRRATTVALADEIHTGFVFTGSSTRTLDLVETFDRWRVRPGTRTTLQHFVDAAETVADCTGNAQAFMVGLRQYIDLLSALDVQANIGIFGPGHRLANAIATRTGVLYKPCGAGGGDCGIAVSTEAEAIDRFLVEVAEHNLVPLPLEVDGDGVAVAAH